MNWLTENAVVAWIGLALVLAAIEAMTVDFVFVMFAGGAVAGAIAAAVGGSFLVQVVAAAVVALLLLAVVRPIITRHFVDGEIDHGIGAPSLVGREARVLDAVTRTGGRIKLGGEVWSATLAEGAPICEPGTEVRVLAISGATAIVTPVPPLG
ncbi:MAG: NfeD family protein [Tetrasphaera sp.]|nr:NfeD family protein [Tetrasphaera sp.]